MGLTAGNSMKASPAVGSIPRALHNVESGFFRPERSDLDLNWLSFYLALLAVPAMELLSIFSGQKPSVPLPRSVALNLLALVLTYLGVGIPPFMRRPMVHRLKIAWLLASGAFISFASIKHNGIPYFLCNLGITATVAGLFLAAGTLLKNSSEKYGKLIPLLAGVIAICIGSSFVHGMLRLTIFYLKSIYDPVLYRIDNILSLSNVTFLARIFFWNNFSQNILLFLYNALVIFIIFSATSEFFYKKSSSGSGLTFRFLIVALSGYSLYYLMPALAPEVFFGQLFPNALPNMQAVADHGIMAPLPIAASATRNTMPSLHATWAILGFLSLRHSPAWHKAAGALYVLAILIVTLGCGFHYTVDWIVALPLVLLSRGIGAMSLPLQLRSRRNAVLVGALLLCLWVLVIRGAPETLDHQKLIQLLAVTSVGLPAWLERRLAKDEDAASADILRVEQKTDLSANDLSVLRKGRLPASAP
ncbi:MAG TPA: phosphatase PAP2 family protein [Acetobacteraceae bacterium]|nr:phosphatase PAP2 family protein [Acetobacteraceae bacterium]